MSADTCPYNHPILFSMLAVDRLFRQSKGCSHRLQPFLGLFYYLRNHMIIIRQYGINTHSKEIFGFFRII